MERKHDRMRIQTREKSNNIRLPSVESYDDKKVRLRGLSEPRLENSFTNVKIKTILEPKLS